MFRYFLTLAYRGTAYSGWQSQPNAPSVQQTLEGALSVILREKIEITGCGRTDAGVHARYYVAHFDAENPLPKTFLIGLNSLLPDDIAVYDVRQVASDAHARYDAVERGYQYHISLRKTPFDRDFSWVFLRQDRLDFSKMQEVASLLLQYESFFPFCKTDSGLDHYRCQMRTASWQYFPEKQEMIFTISANRFLRGMVRLIVGACVQTAQGQMQLADIKNAMDQQTMLRKSLSAPPQGLFLTKVDYPF